MFASFTMIFVVLLMVVLSVHTCSGQDEGQCSYWYEPHPLSNVCPCGVTVLLDCIVTVPQGLSILVRWYRTQNEDFTAEEPTEIQHTPGNGKYVLDGILSTLPDQNGFVSGFFQLGIFDFCDDDTGYYWCQIVINGGTTPDPLEPSHSWNITSGNDTARPPGDPCSSGVATPRKCAEFLQKYPNSSVTSIVLMTQLNPTSTLQNEGTSLNPTSTPQNEGTSLNPTSTLPVLNNVTSSEAVSMSVISTSSRGIVLLMTPTSPLVTESTKVSPHQTLPVSGRTTSQCMIGGSPRSVVYAAVATSVFVVLVGGSVTVVVVIVYTVRRRRRNEKQGTTRGNNDEDYYSYPEVPQRLTQTDNSPNTTTYQSLALESMNYTSMYSTLDPHKREIRVCTTERDGQVYAVADSSRVEPPHQYASLQST